MISWRGELNRFQTRRTPGWSARSFADSPTRGLIHPGEVVTIAERRSSSFEVVPYCRPRWAAIERGGEGGRASTPLPRCSLFLLHATFGMEGRALSLAGMMLS